MIDRGKLVKITGHVVTSGAVPQKAGEKLMKSAIAALRNAFGHIIPINVEVRRETGKDGAQIVLHAHSSTGMKISSSALAPTRQFGQETRVAREAVHYLVEDWNTGSCVDRYLQDQLIIFMALAKGTSYLRTGPVTLHTQTAIHFAKRLLGAKIDVVPLTEWVRPPGLVQSLPANGSTDSDEKKEETKLADSSTTHSSELDDFELITQTLNQGSTPASAESDRDSFMIVCYGIGLQNPYLSEK